MIERVAWSPDAERVLSRALAPLIVPIVADEVRRGLSMLWECKEGTHHAYCVTRVDDNPREFVVVAFAGSGLMTFGPHFVAAARSRNIPLRAHTTSPVIVRLVRPLGFRHAEYVLRAA